MYILYTSAQSVHCNTIQLCLSGMHTDLEIIPFVFSPLPCLPFKHLVGNTALSAQRTHREQSYCGPVKQPKLFSQQPYIIIFFNHSYTLFLHHIFTHHKPKLCIYISKNTQSAQVTSQSFCLFFPKLEYTISTLLQLDAVHYSLPQ